MTTPISPYVDATGCHTFDLPTCSAWLTGQFTTTFGSDVYLGSDTQDGQIINRVAEAMADFNAAFASAYKARSPASAVGVGLSKIVKINGIYRRVSTYSTVPVLCVGQAGTPIGNALIADPAGNLWQLPLNDGNGDPLTIPYVGQVQCLATCVVIGAIAVPAGAMTQIVTSIAGWQSVVNLEDASLGAAVETDPQLRVRQSQSTMLGATGVLQSLFANLEQISGVNTVTIAENDTNAPDANGLPGHSISCVVDGGDPDVVGQMIATRKPPGVNTYGNVVVGVTDAVSNITNQIGFFRPTQIAIACYVGLKPLVGYSPAIQAQIVASLSAYVNGLGDGVGVVNRRAAIAAGLNNGPGSQTFEIESFTMNRGGANPTIADVPIAFNETASTSATYITVTPLAS